MWYRASIQRAALAVFLCVAVLAVSVSFDLAAPHRAEAFAPAIALAGAALVGALLFAAASYPAKTDLADAAYDAGCSFQEMMLSQRIWQNIVRVTGAATLTSTYDWRGAQAVRAWLRSDPFASVQFANIMSAGQVSGSQKYFNLEPLVSRVGAQVYPGTIAPSGYNPSTGERWSVMADATFGGSYVPSFGDWAQYRNLYRDVPGPKCETGTVNGFTITDALAASVSAWIGASLYDMRQPLFASGVGGDAAMYNEEISTGPRFHFQAYLAAGWTTAGAYTSNTIASWTYNTASGYVGGTPVSKADVAAALASIGYLTLSNGTYVKSATWLSDHKNHVPAVMTTTHPLDKVVQIPATVAGSGTTAKTAAGAITGTASDPTGWTAPTESVVPPDVWAPSTPIGSVAGAGTLTEIADAVDSFVPDATNWLSDITGLPAGFIELITAMLTPLLMILRAMAAMLRGVATIITSVQTMSGSISAQGSTALDIKSLLTALPGAVASALGLSALFSTVTTAVNALPTSVKDALGLSALFSAVNTAIGAVNTSVTDAVNAMSAAVVNALGDVYLDTAAIGTEISTWWDSTGISAKWDIAIATLEGLPAAFAEIWAGEAIPGSDWIASKWYSIRDSIVSTLTGYLWWFDAFSYAEANN